MSFAEGNKISIAETVTLCSEQACHQYLQHRSEIQHFPTKTVSREFRERYFSQLAGIDMCTAELAEQPSLAFSYERYSQIRRVTASQVSLSSPSHSRLNDEVPCFEISKIQGAQYWKGHLAQDRSHNPLSYRKSWYPTWRRKKTKGEDYQDRQT